MCPFQGITRPLDITYNVTGLEIGQFITSRETGRVSVESCTQPQVSSLLRGGYTRVSPEGLGVYLQWYAVVLNGMLWYLMACIGTVVLNSVQWYSMVCNGTQWYAVVFSGVQLYSMVCSGTVVLNSV